MSLSSELSSAWWRAKLAALLHDPPWKQWIVARRMSSISGKGHEGDAKLILGEDLGIEVSDYIWECIRRADEFAAGLDRMLSEAIPENLFAHKLVNMFDAESTIDIAIDADPTEVRKRIESFRDRLREVVSTLRSRGVGDDIVYKVMYVALEAIWSNHFKLPQLADTRVPTHTIFDHLAATAMMLNAVCCSDWALVQVDIPGIQLFVSTGRKTRDFWAGSWLLSAITWKLIEELVDRLGPDIVLAPSLHANPFYLTYIVSKLINAKVISEPREIERLGIPSGYLKDGWPSQPVMPATITLVLPIPRGYENDALCAYVKRMYSELGIDVTRFEHSLRKYFEERLLEIWKGVSSSIVRALEDDAILSKLMEALCKHMCRDSSDSSCIDECVKINRELLEKLTAVPPFGLRVYVVRSSVVKPRIERLLREVKSIEKLRKLCEDRDLQNIVRRYGTVYVCESLEKGTLIEANFLWKILALQAMLAGIHDASLEEPNIQGDHVAKVSRAVHEYTKKVYEDPRFGRWRYCSVCGSLPAVVRVPRYDEKDSDDVRKLLHEIEFMLDEGEALCPYCLVRRALWKRIRRVRVIETLYGINLASVKSESLISTLDVASYWSLAKALYEKPEVRRELTELGYVERPSSEEVKEVRERFESAIKRLGVSVDRLGFDVGELATALTLADRVATLGIESVLRLLELEAGTEKHPLYRELRDLISRNLAYVKGDGDNIGKGYWRGALRKDPESYIESIIVRSGLLSAVEDSYRGKILGLAKEFHKTIVDIARELGIASPGATTVMSPSYIMSLSRALTLTAIIDSMIIESVKGVLIYAGGDDVSFISGSRTVAFEACNRSLNVVLLSALSTLLELYREPRKSVPSALREELEKALGTELIDGYSSPALLAILLTRMNYWGELAKYFSAVAVEGFHALKGFFAPALRAFGRSYGVLVTHYREPMWLAMASAAGLEELKDALSISSCTESRKDVVIASYGRGRGAVAKLLNAMRSGSRVQIEQTMSVIHAVFFRREWGFVTHGLALSHAIANAVAKGMISKSFLYDVEDYLSTISRASVDEKELGTAIEKVLKRVALRNTPERYRDAISRLIDSATRSNAHSSIVSVEGSGARQLHILNIARIARIVSR